jgi:hypothetical protein
MSGSSSGLMLLDLIMKTLCLTVSTITLNAFILNIFGEVNESDSDVKSGLVNQYAHLHFDKCLFINIKKLIDDRQITMHIFSVTIPFEYK